MRSKEQPREVSTYTLPANPFAGEEEATPSWALPVLSSEATAPAAKSEPDAEPMPRKSRKGREDAPASESVTRLSKSEGKVHVAAMHVTGESKRAAREQEREATELSREVARERDRTKKARAKAAYEERQQLNYLPKAGERRPNALRTYRPASAPAVKITADIAAHAYPFLAEAGLGSQGIFVGSDAWSGAAFVFDPWELYEQQVLSNPNILVAGVIGKGKALALDTPIATRNGWSTMGELEPGDEVFDEQGQATKIIAATEVMHGRTCYEVTFSDDATIIADAEHQWVTATWLERETLGKAASVRTTEEIRSTLMWGPAFNHAVDTKEGEWRCVIAVTPIESVPVRCIQVAARSAMYLAGRELVPTHNSSLIKSITARSISVGRRVVVASDPKGEWTAVARAVGGQAIELGGNSGNRLNPLDAPVRPTGYDDDAWKIDTRRRRRDLLGALAESSLGRDLYAVESTALDVALDTAVAGNDVPLLGQVVTALLDPRTDVLGSTETQLREDGREVGHALRRLVEGDLKGLFDGPSSVVFDATLPMVSIDMSRVSGSNTLIAMVSTCAAAWIEAAVLDPNGGQRWIVYDEAWRLLKDPALLARMQSQWKLSRAYGLANVCVIHRLSDLDAVGDESSAARNLALGLLADCSTKVIYAQERGEATATGRRLGLTEVEIEHLPGLSRGQGLWRVGERSFLVNHLMTPGELSLFDTNARMKEAS